MSWAAEHVKKLQAGETVTFKPRGRSMEPIIMDGQEVTVTPVLYGNGVEAGDVVLCKVQGHHYLHLVKRHDAKNHKFLIGNNKGKLNGWIDCAAIYGKRVKP